jgi:hypothetical protein
MKKKRRGLKWLLINISKATTNQKYAGVAEYTLERR